MQTVFSEPKLSDGKTVHEQRAHYWDDGSWIIYSPSASSPFESIVVMYDANERDITRLFFKTYLDGLWEWADYADDSLLNEVNKMKGY